jgi:DnaJ-class molecular chaperone
MSSSGEDPGLLLTDAGQWTEPWGASNDSDRCDKCAGEGSLRHECWSCETTGPDDDCPACGGAVNWRAACPVCRGSDRIDGAPRHGVSAFPTVEGLYRYMLAKEADLEGCVLVTMEASPAEDVDFDADQGALLVLPVEILAREPVDLDLAERVGRSS